MSYIYELKRKNLNGYGCFPCKSLKECFSVIEKYVGDNQEWKIYKNPPNFSQFQTLIRKGIGKNKGEKLERAKK